MCLFSVYMSPCEYLMNLLVAHTTSKNLLSMVHVIVCYVLWPTKIKFLEVFNTFLGCEKSKEWGNLINLNFSLKILVLKIIWSHEHSCHIIKTVFQMILHKIFPKFFKISVSSKFNWSSSFFDRLKCDGEKWLFLLKVLGSFDSCPIPFNQSSLFSYVFRFLFDSSRPIGF